MKIFSHLLPYLLLVSFSAGPMNDFGLAKMKAINRSSYDGVAVRLTSPYDTGHHSMSDFAKAVRFFRDKSGKQIWPWIFFNRFVGSEEGGKTHSPLSNTPAFRRIKGMDIYNKEGALEDFFTRMRISLAISRRLGSPGIVIDPELYNDYGVSDISRLAKRLGKPEGEVKRSLEAVGARMCDIADKQYPGATMWFLDTGLSGKGSRPFFSSGRHYRSFTHIILGLLERAGSKHSRITVISGGEISLTYCQKSLEGLEQRIKQRGMDYEPLLEKYPNLALGGTIAPWISSGAKKGWMKEGNCGASKIKDLDEFRPLVKKLLASYNHVWIYGAWAGGYDPFRTVAQGKIPLGRTALFKHQPYDLPGRGVLPGTASHDVPEIKQ